MPQGKHDKLWFDPQTDQLIEFEYVNHRGNQYTYVIEPEGVAIGGYEPGGISSNPADVCFVIHGMVVTRDDGTGPDTRPDMQTRRRTFMISKIVGAIRVLERSK